MGRTDDFMVVGPIHPLILTAAVLGFRSEVSASHHAADSGVCLAVVKALASLDPVRGLAALTTTSVECRYGSYVMAGFAPVRQQECSMPLSGHPKAAINRHLKTGN
jgi:hypothetical protein